MVLPLRRLIGNPDPGVTFAVPILIFVILPSSKVTGNKLLLIVRSTIMPFRKITDSKLLLMVKLMVLPLRRLIGNPDPRVTFAVPIFT